MNILVTGGAGFIGTNFIHLLMNETDHRVVNFDALTYAGSRLGCGRFEDDPRYTFIKGSICDRKAVESAVMEYRIDAIVNFAAESHVDRSIHDSSSFIHTNVLGTDILLAIARERKVRLFVQISTDEVYGDLTLEEPEFTEISPIKPSSPYAASKAAADMLVLASFRTHRQPVIITRCSNNYGPYQYPEKFIPLTISRTGQQKPIPVYGRGQNVRDWIYVEDHCRGILKAMNKGKAGEVYNFGGRCERKNIDVTKTILKIMKKSEDLIRFVADRPGHDLRYAINFTKAQRELGWSPGTVFEDGLSRTIKWYNDNEEWLRSVMSNQYESFCEKHYGVLK